MLGLNFYYFKTKDNKMKTLKEKHQFAYDQLNKNHVHWDRRDKNHIVIWVLGYHHADCFEIEKFLMPLGFFMIEMEFDKICGKTKCVYNHK